MATTVSVPWTETVIDPFGKCHETTLTLDVPIEDIWKWQRYYVQRAKPEPAPTPHKVDKHSPEFKARVGISKRLSSIEAGNLSNIGGLIKALKDLSLDLLASVVENSKDRLRDVTNLPSLSEEDRAFLTSITGT